MEESGPHQRGNLLEDLAQPVALELKVVAALQVHPEPLGCAEVARESEPGVGADPTLAMDYLVDATGRHTDRQGQPMLAECQGGRYSSTRTSPGCIGGNSATVLIAHLLQ